MNQPEWSPWEFLILKNRLTKEEEARWRANMKTIGECERQLYQFCWEHEIKPEELFDPS